MNDICTINNEINEADSQHNEEKNKEIENFDDNGPNIVEKEKIPGVIYISSMPKGMGHIHLRHLMEPYGDIGRIFLQKRNKNKKITHRYIKQ